MRKDIPDTMIRAHARNVLARHWIDLSKLVLGCFRGTLRLRGELRHHGPLESTPIVPATIERLELELKGLRGVRRVHLGFDSWTREDGEWRRIRRERVLEATAAGGTYTLEVAGDDDVALPPAPTFD